MEKKRKKETLESEEISNKTEKEIRRNKGRKKGRERDRERLRGIKRNGDIK